MSADATTYLVSVAGYAVKENERSSAGFGVVVRRGEKCREWSVHVCNATRYQARRRGEAFILELLKHREESRESGPNYGKKFPYVWLTSGPDLVRALAIAQRAACKPIEPTYQEVS